MSDLQWALDELNPSSHRMRRYGLYAAYYNGAHRLAFATDNYRSTFWRIFENVSDNLCASVVDVQTERLEIVGFSTNKAQTTLVPVERDGQVRTVGSVSDSVGEALWAFWEEKDLDVVSEEIHRDVLKFGDGFAIVWDEEEQGPTVWPQPADQMAVRYSEEYYGQLEVAAKYWEDTGNNRYMTLYYPDRIERFIAEARHNGVRSESWREREWKQLDPETHALGRVPVVHFPNKACYKYGVSELRDVVPLQDALNKEICDMLVAMEFQAFRQRWITGVEMEVDPDTGKPKDFPFAAGADRMLVLGDKDSRVGEFGQVDVAPFLNAQRDFRAEIARVSGIPLHYFFVSSLEAPSGEALKTAELRFTRKLQSKQRSLGKLWENTMGRVLELGGDLGTEGLDINAEWSTATARSESEVLDAMTKKRDLGVPLSQIQRELAYDPEQITQFAQESDVGFATQPQQPPPQQPPTTPPETP